MGEKGARLTGSVTERAAQLVADLAPLGDVTSKPMFGGAGIFEAGVMFAMVDSKGAVALRADKDTSVALESAGGHKHGRMPYWTISDDVAGDTDTLLEWAQTALAVARAAKKK